MFIRRNAAAAIALGFAFAATAAPALANGRTAYRADHPGYNARAEFVGGDTAREVGMPGRAQALRDCNNHVDKLKDYTWGDYRIDQYRACMSEHGQPE